MRLFWRMGVASNASSPLEVFAQFVIRTIGGLLAKRRVSRVQEKRASLPVTLTNWVSPKSCWRKGEGDTHLRSVVVVGGGFCDDFTELALLAVSTLDSSGNWAVVKRRSAPPRGLLFR